MKEEKGQQKLELAIIVRNVEGEIIEQRITDGFINATHLCKAAKKNYADYSRLKTTDEFFLALSDDMGIPMSGLTQAIRGGEPKHQGTWVHPQVAIHLGIWASPKFAVFISKWVTEWLKGNIPNKNKLPYHVQRYIVNRSEIPSDHFSVLNELFLLLIAPLESFGYELPDSLVPDISEGRMFAGWVRDTYGLNAEDFPTYTHTYPDGRIIPGVRLYPNKFLEAFRSHFHDVWLKKRAAKYFEEKDKNALPYLSEAIKSLPGNPEPPKKLVASAAAISKIERAAERREANAEDNEPDEPAIEPVDDFFSDDEKEE
jgi:hypothetical protein